MVRAALQLAPMMFLRPGELLVPSIRMRRKKDRKLHGKPHYEPLSGQSLSLMEDLFKLTGHTGVCFPAMGRANKCMSSATLNAALRRMGFCAEFVAGHGFRATARTLLHEVLRIDVDVIELQLAHLVKDMNGRAHNHTEFFGARADMVQKRPIPPTAYPNGSYALSRSARWLLLLRWASRVFGRAIGVMDGQPCG